MSEQGVAATNNKLILAACSGCKTSFTMLARENLPFIAREVGKFVPKCDQEDVVQEVLIRLYRSLPDYQEQGKFLGWLKSLSARASLDYWRKVRRHERSEQQYFEEALTDLTADLALRSDLNACFAELSPEDRIICIMVFLEERSHHEVSELLKMSVVAVKVRCFRLRRKLQKRFTL